MYCNINDSFEDFWCLFDDENIIGTVALKRLDARRCELKSLYLLEKISWDEIRLSITADSNKKSTAGRISGDTS